MDVIAVLANPVQWASTQAHICRRIIKKMRQIRPASGGFLKRRDAAPALIANVVCMNQSLGQALFRNPNRIGMVLDYVRRSS